MFLRVIFVKKRNEEYVPQFDLEENLPIVKKECNCCGKLVNEKNITKEGYCIECVMNNRATKENKFAHPDERTYKNFCRFLNEANKKNRFKHIMAAGVLPLLMQMNTSEFEGDIQKNGSFDKNNKKTVYIRDESWVCPCCLQDNVGPHYCKRCGVYPQFKLID